MAELECKQCHAKVTQMWIECCIQMNCPHKGMKPYHDPVNAPSHYRAGDTYETIRVIEAWALNYNLGNAIKYISRAGAKGNRLQDLEKARWYLNREIDSITKSTPGVDSNNPPSTKAGV